MLANIRVVLVEPKGSGNIGSVARAMKNMGVSDLALVGNARPRSFWARAMAVHARDILAAAKRYASLREAVADCGLVIGTTCRPGLYRSHSRAPREVAPEIVAAARAHKTALVFGPEDRGLSNHDLKHCQWLITIPTHEDYPSLNVAQAAVICLYEIFLAALGETPKEAVARAPAESVERLFDRMQRTLLQIGFLDPQNPDHLMLALRRLFGRAGLEERDVRILSGLFRQIEWYLEGGWKTIEEKKERGLRPR
ncbi:MAG TPA: RNA methyltransferase [Candidatus Acidoferrales bacterium]|nr:RNA methyltransferase [Candidatus Acidoferrales bacterium]